jgi:hypothetical protein
MSVILHDLSRRDDGTIQLSVSCGADPPRVFLATYHGDDPKYESCSMDEELFMLLSDLAHRRFGNCVVYQMEVMGIIAAFAKDEDPPSLPATLGRTRFCTSKPGALRILWNKLWILLDRMGLWRPRVWVHPYYQSQAEQGAPAARPRD